MSGRHGQRREELAPQDQAWLAGFEAGSRTRLGRQARRVLTVGAIVVALTWLLKSTYATPFRIIGAIVVVLAGLFVMDHVMLVMLMMTTLFVVGGFVRHFRQVKPITYRPHIDDDLLP